LPAIANLTQSHFLFELTSNMQESAAYTPLYHSTQSLSS